MRALVVYESMFGNTQAVAKAVATGIETVMPVELVEVGEAPELDEVRADLLVVGAPTHAFGLSRESTREDATQRASGEVTSKRRGVREWLDAASHSELQVATFDTHVKKPNLPGRAANAAERRLRRVGCTPVTKPESFYVHGYEGPLYPGELSRAKTWGNAVAGLAVRATAR